MAGSRLPRHRPEAPKHHLRESPRTSPVVSNEKRPLRISESRVSRDPGRQGGNTQTVPGASSVSPQAQPRARCARRHEAPVRFVGRLIPPARWQLARGHGWWICESREGTAGLYAFPGRLCTALRDSEGSEQRIRGPRPWTHVTWKRRGGVCGRRAGGSDGSDHSLAHRGSARCPRESLREPQGHADPPCRSARLGQAGPWLEKHRAILGHR